MLCAFDLHASMNVFTNNNAVLSFHPSLGMIIQGRKFKIYRLIDSCSSINYSTTLERARTNKKYFMFIYLLEKTQILIEILQHVVEQSICKMSMEE